ncbi:MAG TPA: Nif3-like dinuclear metal center hexameric protein [Candidatus Hydrogenedentes bacterium]|nr:Nif3-like dinuclear metal center hexameric protein [Candidatus Hydrogenedentota bacterium]HOS02841.1 Nif3-like dinuclear metal center hexameric protein [Candidatus Hydrogenedentota bacterium]
MPTTHDIHAYLLEHSPWVNRENTVDGCKNGDPMREVRQAGVAWFGSLDTMKKAHADGCDLLIVHEPIFWEHSAEEKNWRVIEPGVAKQQFLDDSGLVVLRAHDSWDNWPGIGIRDSWAAGLGLTKRIKEGTVWNLHGMYEIAPQSLREFARYIARKIAPLGEDSVQVIGDPERIVSRPALGVGCIGPDKEMVESGADVMIVCYDGACYWAVRERLAEMGVAIITLEHGTTEMWGMENLRHHLAEAFSPTPFRYYAEHPRTWTVRTVDSSGTCRDLG